MPDDRIFTEQQLRKYGGDDDLMYIAFQGIVYDVSNCPHWRKGIHEGLHFPGQDLTGEILEAPHDHEVFHFSCVRRVGRLIIPLE